MKEIIVIHEITRDILELPLEKYILTFDDALYSQYYYWPLIEKIKTEKILFVSPCLVNENDKDRSQFDGSHINFPSCYEAMSLYREKNDKSNYMNVNEIKQITGVTIGAHSFSHFKQLDMKLYDKAKFIREDTELMLKWFKEKLNLKPDVYSFPHYIENELQRVILKSYGFKTFFGSEDRHIVETL